MIRIGLTLCMIAASTRALAFELRDGMRIEIVKMQTLDVVISGKNRNTSFKRGETCLAPVGTHLIFTGVADDVVGVKFEGSPFAMDQVCYNGMPTVIAIQRARELARTYAEAEDEKLRKSLVKKRP